MDRDLVLDLGLAGLAGMRYELRVPIAPGEGRFFLAAKDPTASRTEGE
jgi:hypothetical protein